MFGINKSPIVDIALEKRVSAIESDAADLCSRVSEIESDLLRIADLLATGNIDGVKFRQIVTKRQGGGINIRPRQLMKLRSRI